MIGLIASLAAAQEPDPMEVVVWGELAVDRARDELVRELEGLGWSLVRRDGDAAVLRPPEAWMGRIRVSAEGELAFGRPLVGLGTLPEEAWVDDPTQGPSDLRSPRVEAGAGLTLTGPPSRSRLEEVRARALEATADERVALRAVLARTRLEAQVEALPARLDATWSSGAALEPGGPSLSAPADRRAAILEFWATRAETPEGHRVMDAAEAWIGAVLWPAAPPTEAELALWEARRSDGRRLPRPQASTTP